MSNYEKLRIAMRYWLLGKGYENALSAMEFASKKHNGTRKDGSPEFIHQIKIAHYLRTLHNSLIHPEETISAAFIHDTVEDYDVTREEVEFLFGPMVAGAVSKVTKIDRFGGKIDPESLFVEMSSCPIASIVKGADRIHNFSTMDGAFSYQKQLEYIEEAERFIIPMLKSARRTHHRQEAAYENIKLVMQGQMEMTRIAIGLYNQNEAIKNEER